MITNKLFSLCIFFKKILAVKNKMERVGQGKDAERIPVEYVFFTMAVQMDVEGNFLKKMYSIFHKTVKMDIDFIE